MLPGAAPTATSVVQAVGASVFQQPLVHVFWRAVPYITRVGEGKQGEMQCSLWESIAGLRVVERATSKFEAADDSRVQVWLWTLAMQHASS